MIILGEQTNPGVQIAGQQALYPKAAAPGAPYGTLARVNAAGVEVVQLDSNSYAAAASTIYMQVNFWGL